MDAQTVKTHKLSNGMTLLVEEIKDVSSGAFVFLVPAGAARDPQNRGGTAGVLSEHLFRGAGDRNNRMLNDKLDSLGLQRHSGVGSLHSSFSGALIGDNTLETIEIYADILQRAHLTAEHFEPCRGLALQSLESLEDDPRQKISLLIKEKYLPYPFGRPSSGKKEDLQALTSEEVKAHWADSFTPDGTILAVAGKVDFNQTKELVEKCFGSWQGKKTDKLPQGNCQQQFYHQPNEGAQVHISLMYPSAHVCNDSYYKALAAVGVLSGGMGSRLFTEVREKRGLCYAVGAHHNITGPYGAVQCYAGSSPEQAQEALDVMTAELIKLKEGITKDELERAKVGLRASLIMQGESTAARAAACVGDYYHLGRVRSLEEIETAIKSLSVEDVIEYVKSHPAEKFTVATIGPKELKI